MDQNGNQIGNVGPWQAKIVGILGLCGFFNSFQKLSLSFIMKETDFWCSEQSAEIPMGINPQETNPNLTECQTMNNNNSMIPCSQWDYDRDIYPETAVTQYNLVCGERYWVDLSQTVYLSGYVLGSFASGLIADRFGRRPTILISATSYLVLSTLVSFSPTIIIFNILRFSTAACVLSLYNISFTYCMEIVGGQWVAAVSVIFGVIPSLGYMFVPFLSWLFPRWTSLQLAITWPVIFIILPLCVPGLFKESPRWLSANGFVKEAVVAEKKSTEANSVPVEDVTTNEHICEPNISKASLKDLFLTPGICRSTLILAYIWCVFIIIYNFVIMNAESFFPGDPLVNIEVLSVLEILSCLVTMLVIVHVKRRISLSIFFVITGVSFILTFCLNNSIIRQILTHTGQFINTCSFNIMFVYTAEIYPTVVRNMGFGTVNACGRAGAAVAPLVVSMLGNGEGALLFGIMSILAGFLIWILPETKDLSLVDSLEDGEKLNRTAGILHFEKSQRKQGKNISPTTNEAYGST